jgi:hypothetical protein
MLLSRPCRSKLVLYSDDPDASAGYRQCSPLPCFISPKGTGNPSKQHPKRDQEESQDEYGQFDLNWDDPMVLAALNNAAEPAPVAVPVLTMQYTYQSLIEVGRSILMLPILELNFDHRSNTTAFQKRSSPTLFDNMIDAFEIRRQQDRLRTGAESVS